MGKMLERRGLDEFRDTGLLLFINQFLHIFGWAIVVEYDDDTDEPIAMFPAKCKFRGFFDKDVSEAYIKVSEYMNEHASDLLKDSKEE